MDRLIISTHSITSYWVVFFKKCWEDPLRQNLLGCFLKCMCLTPTTHWLFQNFWECNCGSCLVVDRWWPQTGISAIKRRGLFLPSLKLAHGCCEQWAEPLPVPGPTLVSGRPGLCGGTLRLREEGKEPAEPALHSSPPICPECGWSSSGPSGWDQTPAENQWMTPGDHLEQKNQPVDPSQSS